jgi:hypothetical protein
MMNLVNSVPIPAAMQPYNTGVTKVEAIPSMETKPDSFTKATAAPPKIGRWRLFFGYLTKNQIKAVNESKLLPENAKFEGRYHVANNWFNITKGTRVLPDTHELKRNIFGFTRVVPKGTKGLFIKG